MELISIVVPIYNVKSYLPHCLNSILAQRGKNNLEILLVDDGSTDGCSEICDEYSLRDERVRVLHKPNGGLIKARIDGVKMARGDWIAFVDGDDWIAPNMIEKLVGLIEEKKADIAISAAWIANEENYDLKKNDVHAGVYSGKALEQIKNRLLGEEEYFSFSILPYLWNKIWRKSLLMESLREVDTSIMVGEDVAIGFPAILLAQKVVVTNKAYYYYRQNQLSMLNQKKDQKREILNAGRLHHYLRKSLIKLEYADLAGERLLRLWIHQILTRAYGLSNHLLESHGLFPFIENVNGSIVIYGAGAFGKAVYEYANERFQVKAWVDSNAAFLKTMGYPVVTLEEVEIKADDIVVIPIFLNMTVEVIQNSLLRKGVKKENIFPFRITQEQEKRLLNVAEQMTEVCKC